MTGRIIDFARLADGAQRITVQVREECRELIDRLRDETVDIDIKKHRNKRSLDANAYAWVLIGKIAMKLSQPKAPIYKNDVYREAIRNINGVSDILCVPNDSVERVCQMWCAHGLGWQAEKFPSQLNGWTNVMVYAGSSEYDTAQMSEFIDYLIAEAKELGIETATPEEIQRYKDLWGKE